MRKLILTCGYLGYLPLAPGTFGTLPAMGLYLLAARTRWADLVAGAALLGACAACVAWGEWAQGEFKAKDPRPFVLDEFAGYLVSILFLGGGDVGSKAIIAFFAFRFFDVVKPFPAGRLEALGGRWGILLDDLAAGVYANIAARLVLYALSAKGLLPVV